MESGIRKAGRCCRVPDDFGILAGMSTEPVIRPAEPGDMSRVQEIHVAHVMMQRSLAGDEPGGI